MSVEVSQQNDKVPGRSTLQYPSQGLQEGQVLHTAVRPVRRNNCERHIPNLQVQGDDPLVHRGKYGSWAEELKAGTHQLAASHGGQLQSGRVFPESQFSGSIRSHCADAGDVTSSIPTHTALFRWCSCSGLRLTTIQDTKWLMAGHPGFVFGSKRRNNTWKHFHYIVVEKKTKCGNRWGEIWPQEKTPQILRDISRHSIMKSR